MFKLSNLKDIQDVSSYSFDNSNNTALTLLEKAIYLYILTLSLQETSVQYHPPLPPVIVTLAIYSRPFKHLP